MPNPNQKIHAIIWSKTDIPSKLEYDVLCHLASDPEARVYVPPDRYSASVSNAGGVPGWTRRGRLDHILWGGFGGKKPYSNEPNRPWVELDKATTRRCRYGIKAYRITSHGFEAIAQYDARLAYEERHLVLARRLLRHFRKKAHALRQS